MTLSKRVALAASFLTLVTAGIAAALLFSAGAGLAAEEATVVTVAPEVIRWGFISAALATGLSALGAAYAVARVGSAAVGALTEKPELLGRVLILVGLAEGIAIYGLIIAILILNRIA
jgi:V/A-type H+-transporting ATPase subunit K